MNSAKKRKIQYLVHETRVRFKKKIDVINHKLYLIGSSLTKKTDFFVSIANLSLEQTSVTCGEPGLGLSYLMSTL